MLPVRRVVLNSGVKLSAPKRQFGFSPIRSDLFDFFRQAGVKEEKPNAVASAQKTKDVMKSIETGESQSVSDKRIKLRVLGAPPEDNSWEIENNGFTVNAWPMKITAPELTEAEVTESLQIAFNQHFKHINEDTTESSSSSSSSWLNQKLDDLTIRFNFTKDISHNLGVIIPDSVLSRVETVGDIYDYLTSKVAGKRFDEMQPEAIYLDPKDFEGFNISIRDAIAEKRAKKTNFKQALADAKRAERERQEELLQSALKE